jgi:hypothetical protein
MNRLKYYLIGLLCTVQLSAFAAKKDKDEEPKRVYMYGMAVNFNDSTMYLTDVHYLDSMIINKDGSLQNYIGYSMQLKAFLEGTLGETNQTCAVIYSDKKKKLDKRFTKMRKRYEADKNKTLRRVGTDAFTFQKR